MVLDVDLWMLKRMPGYARPLIIEPCNAEVGDGYRVASSSVAPVTVVGKMENL